MIWVERIVDSYYSSNCYLLEGGLLVDVGMDAGVVLSRAVELQGRVKLRQVEPSETGIGLVVLTHCHYDHLAGAPEVLRETGARLAVHRADAVLLRDSRATVADLFGEEPPELEPDVVLLGGEILGGLEVIHTPGHTPGSICLYHSGSRSLFSGDTVFPDGGVGRTDLPGGDLLKLIDSLEKLAGLRVEALYPGHGEPTTARPEDQIRLSLELARSLI